MEENEKEAYLNGLSSLQKKISQLITQTSVKDLSQGPDGDLKETGLADPDMGEDMGGTEDQMLEQDSEGQVEETPEMDEESIKEYLQKDKKKKDDKKGGIMVAFGLKGGKGKK